jgi:hypothetical protein
MTAAPAHGTGPPSPKRRRPPLALVPTGPDVHPDVARFDPTAAGTDPDPAPGLTRPPGRGVGLDGPACVERLRFTQSSLGRPDTAMCLRCGRITARRSVEDGMPWCGGNLAAP